MKDDSFNGLYIVGRRDYIYIGFMKEDVFFGSAVLLSYRSVIYGTFDDLVCKGTVLLPDGT